RILIQARIGLISLVKSKSGPVTLDWARRNQTGLSYINHLASRFRSPHLETLIRRPSHQALVELTLRSTLLRVVFRRIIRLLFSRFFLSVSPLLQIQIELKEMAGYVVHTPHLLSYTLHYVLLHRIYTLSLWFCSEEAEKTAPALGEPMDLMTALQLVMKKSLAHDGLVRGLHEAAKAIEKHAAQLCILAEDCNQSDYVKLVKALCADHNVHLVTVPSAKTLGEWAGVSIFSCLLSFKTFNLGCVFLHIKIPLKILFSCRTSILMYG
ncbi:hypothetical protein B296_00038608, partial [Ensete ventricosum]